MTASEYQAMEAEAATDTARYVAARDRTPTPVPCSIRPSPFRHSANTVPAKNGKHRSQTMKPLELTVYPKIGSVYYDDEANCTWSETMVYGLSVEKRLTDAELAAEHHRAKWTGLLAEKHDSLTDEGRAKIATVHRFATLPHYDQEEAQA